MTIFGLSMGGGALSCSPFSVHPRVVHARPLCMSGSIDGAGTAP
jgi:hypothetical protein